ncbi:putative membrane protein [Herbinix hemicellulosilytica]|uniref:Putative membrane protein n=1 Tax=Herbinix hemicellulosilytica TaxID=1564487 RepID=A0A0H5SEI0_HERHM|nr:ECF transporter S component [Herbinix hemicellulosilytica]RBP55317.1 putative membrane protein [Herbinix hemicellulosilytica]CRZ33266.1 putative membrane protein [Herbinix hemicellulosilytica]
MIVKERTLKMVQLAMFTAIILLLAFTPLGYIKLSFGLSVTLIGLPVIIGAITIGPVGGAVLGAVFGLTSFAQAFGPDVLGVILLGENPIGLFITCLVPRVFMGLLTGLIFKLLKRIDKSKFISYALTNLIGSLLNTVLFLTSLMIFFYDTLIRLNVVEISGKINPFMLAAVLAGFNALAEALVCLVIGTAVSKSIDVFAARA